MGREDNLKLKTEIRTGKYPACESADLQLIFFNLLISSIYCINKICYIINHIHRYFMACNMVIDIC